MATRLRRLYWDANCFIALLNREPTTDPGALQAIQTTYEDMLRGQVKVVTSEIFRAEVFGANSTIGQTIYNELLACLDFEIVASPGNLFDEVGKLRVHVKDATKGKQNIHLADAIHVVVASLSDVDEMWTTDQKVVNKAEAGLLGSLKICFPHVDQPRLIF